MLALGLVTVALGYVGFASQLPGKHYPMDLLYRSGGLFAFKGAEDVVPGPVKDAVKKTSPFLVPQVNHMEQVKDLYRNAIRALHAILARADLMIVQRPKARQCLSAMVPVV